MGNLDQQTAEQFAQTVNKLKGKVTFLFITHQLPKGLQVVEAVVLGRDNTTSNEQPHSTITPSTQQASAQKSSFEKVELVAV